MGGIVGGIFTPTEASVVSVAYAIVLTCFIYKEVSFRQVYETFKKVGVNCSIILFIVSTAGLIGQVANRAHLPQELSQLLFVVTDDRTVLILLILGLLLFLGCLLETLSLLIIMTPFLVPVMTTLGFSPTHMGITIILPTMIGLITPPVGLSMYIACEIAQVNMVTYTKEAFFFILILIIVCLLVAYFPALSISVSNLVFGPE
jgi:C4-dicarboxylate transporter DctM subunit